ncbi:FMN-dependent NADH-azoreductase [Sphingoaurantiacus capsulatus]|uniref:FMN dependent NADH:quinone oxidoreductase n=1 Tax=Sphingoaurantiacus capsulatus TaxID=1771310 RepID=A0ABV7X5M9_9SPHN
MLASIASRGTQQVWTVPMKLLHLDSSIQGDASASRRLSAAIVEQLRGSDASLEVRYRDLAAAPLPHITLPGLAREAAVSVLDEFLAADIIVIGAPMYNFGLPTQLKAWFDHILIAGKTFRYGEQGVEGLAGGKRVVVALSRGGIYAASSPMAANEHAEAHVRAMLGFIGITDLTFIVAEGVAFGEEVRAAAMEGALAEVKAIGVHAQAA